MTASFYALPNSSLTAVSLQCTSSKAETLLNETVRMIKNRHSLQHGVSKETTIRS
jgi:hypothetical protein